MDIDETMAQIRSQLEQIERNEQENQREQAEVTELILNLETELKQLQRRRNELDEEALKLYTQAEELRPKLNKLERISNLSKDFLELHHECQDNQDLLSTLYSSISTESVEDTNQALLNSPLFKQTSTEPTQSKTIAQDYSQYSITIDEIKQALPNAEKVYQKLVANYLEEYKTYQNYIVDGLDVIWYAVAFIAFGRPSYRKMGFKYHPDLDGSERAMQLVNTAWSVSQRYLKNSAESNNTMNSL
ncbi:MAG: molecular chaperone DnaJ [Pleurocapsa minor HA4230-MV1]|jgi:chromosome segregation ATPase|nr:molecular chaperone DnaJ [Pleurocapsa minor HA4230-MV1]